MPDSAFPPEITEAILRLLPAKSLGRFRSVSKTWNSLISDPQFIKNHLLHLQTTNIIFISNTKTLYSLHTNQLLPYLLNINTSHDDEICVTVKEVTFVFKEVLGSCNGLVLAEDRNGSIFLINPTTRDRWEVPFPPLPTLPDREFYVTYYGFGYYSSTDDYKVVTISVRYNRNILLLPEFIDTCVSVYSLRNNSWKKVPNSLSYDHGLCRVVPVVVNQNVHWYSNSSTIVAFSFITEEFNVFRLQLFELFKGKMVGIDCLIDIDGKLGLCFRVGGDVYELWVMEEYGVNNSWKEVCCLEFRFRYLEPVCLVQGSNRDIILDVEGEVYVFNIDEKRWRDVWIEGWPLGFIRVAATYAESIESPKRILRAS